MKSIFAFIGFCVVLKYVCLGIQKATEEEEEKHGYTRL